MSKRSRIDDLPRANRHVGAASNIRSKGEGELFDLLESRPQPLLLVLDQVQDPHNLGACLRTANAAGVDAVIAPADRSASITEAVRRIACGGAENTPFVQVTNLARCLDKLKEIGIWIVGTADEAGRDYFELDLKGPVALVLGSEGVGLRRLTRERCDFLARVPMRGKVECLNVSVAAGVCLFEAVRQRSRMKS